jgi:hypothetical protein
MDSTLVTPRRWSRSRMLVAAFIVLSGVVPSLVVGAAEAPTAAAGQVVSEHAVVDTAAVSR